MIALCGVLVGLGGTKKGKSPDRSRGEADLRESCDVEELWLTSTASKRADVLRAWPLGTLAFVE